MFYGIENTGFIRFGIVGKLTILKEVCDKRAIENLIVNKKVNLNLIIKFRSKVFWLCRVSGDALKVCSFVIVSKSFNCCDKSPGNKHMELFRSVYHA